MEKSKEEIMKELEAWLATSEAKEALLKASERARIECEKLKEARKIDPLDLMRPVDL